MGLRGDACIVGYSEWKAERHPTGEPRMPLHAWADVAAAALADAGIDAHEVDGICCAADISESLQFQPATIAEYCGFSVNFAERLDLGGASAVGMVWRAAAAIELGLCEVVVCATVIPPLPMNPIRRVLGMDRPSRGRGIVTTRGEFDVGHPTPFPLPFVRGGGSDPPVRFWA